MGRCGRGPGRLFAAPVGLLLAGRPAVDLRSQRPRRARAAGPVLRHLLGDAGDLHPRRQRARLRDDQVQGPQRRRRARRAARAAPRQPAGRGEPDRGLRVLAGHHRDPDPQGRSGTPTTSPRREKANAYEVTATGYQWWFKFDYPNETAQTPDADGQARQRPADDGQRARDPGGPAGPHQPAHGRRHPQLLGPQARRQGGHGAQPRRTSSGSRPTSPGISGGSAPSSAASPTRSCASA